MKPEDIVLEVLRICDHCNKEYTCATIKKDKYPHVGFCKNKVKCPLCGETLRGY